MALYAESVELWPEGRRGLLLALVFGAVLLLLFLKPIPITLPDLVSFVMSNLYLLAMLAGAIVLAFSNRLDIELTDEHLLLRIGVHRKKIDLESVARAEVRTAPPSELKISPWALFSPSFVSAVVPTQVELTLTGGDKFRFSSQHAGHLVQMIESGAQRRQREAAIRATSERR
jgi:hypothetical protein